MKLKKAAKKHSSDLVAFPIILLLSAKVKQSFKSEITPVTFTPQCSRSDTGMRRKVLFRPGGL